MVSHVDFCTLSTGSSAARLHVGEEYVSTYLWPHLEVIF